MADWIPIALGRDVPDGVTRAVIVDNREVMIWRGEDGMAHVWEDRCPHRGMRLSLGFVRGNALNCLYHGWQYGAGANCLRIPAHPDLTLPPTIRANAYAAAETGGMVWMNGDSADPPPLLPEQTPVVSLAVEAAPERVLAALGGSTAQPLIALPFAGGALQVGWHRAHAAKTMLHATGADVDIAAATAHLRALRQNLEQGAAA
ncbi:MAG TPA: Rieske 2Fe-2S domain-containing protein [Devosia sp.]|jgi:phenylpropionate dioxygenase-like ring-hydroxylating dioxygenase large terminal subunit|uniref:Rieske 2Fe-2S domain-containing protein n=1 Tax=Devosia sp. TaxID=1871048 RepID=UPI002DDDB0DC|nr:Rieske 2Fe-2S domain-containing protein [Devosia sp.]HEV2516702.1 Rieske 2Fe-2S domain-containing protein [Devosia sp.]